MNPERPVRVVPLWQRLLIGRRPVRTLIRAAIMVVAAFLIFYYALWPVRIDGNSMLPAYHTGQVNFINHLSYRWHPPRRGDVVGIMMAGKHLMLLKRVVGLPNETFAIERGTVLINGRPLDEPYVRHRAPWNVEPHTLGSDEYLVIGDNRGMDQQAHSFGIAKANKIAGKILW